MVSRESVQPHVHVNQLIMHEVKSNQWPVCRGLRDAQSCWILCCLPGIITVVIVRSPTQIRDGTSEEGTPASPTDPIPSHRIVSVGAGRLWQHILAHPAVSNLLISNQVPTCARLPARPPSSLPHHTPLQPSSTAFQGWQPSKTKRLAYPSTSRRSH